MLKKISKGGRRLTINNGNVDQRYKVVVNVEKKIVATMKVV